MKTFCLILVGLMAATGITPLTAVTVTNLNDSGPGSLREALAAGGNIEFAVTGTITLTSGELVVNHSTTITGPGAEQLMITRSGAVGTPAFRVLKVQGAPVMISGLTLSNGLVAGNSYNGAGILNEGTLTLSNCVVRGNRSTVSYARGTGLFNANDATLTANRCVFAENVGTGEYAEGGGIYVFGVVNLNDCTIRGNRGEGYYSRGGGLHVDYFGSAGVARCTFSSNSVAGANAQGGGIYNYGRLEIANSTLSGNYSGETGGGIHADALAPNTAIRNCTISGNTARTGAGLCNFGFEPHSNGPRTVKDSIIAGNSPGDIENTGVLASLGHNLFGDVLGNAIAPAAGDHSGVSAAVLRLGPLANNGGPTQTRGLMAGSPAIDAGNPTSFLATDQRGVARPFGSRADIGAFELDVILPPLVTVSATQPNTTEMGPTILVAPGVFTISRSGGTNEPLQVFYRLSGTASNGVDYHHLSNSVVIPAGQSSAELLVLAFFDGLVEETEKAVLHLESPPCLPIYPPPPGCYAVGTPAEAVVNINDYNLPTNRQPTVSLVAPTNGAVFTGPAVIQICADARDADGYVDFVEFFAGTNRLGSRTNCLPCASIQNPFCLVWSDAPVGEHALTAKVTDNQGATTISAPVHVVVHGSGSNNLNFRLAFNTPNAGAGVFFRNYTLAGPAEGNRLLPADRVLAAGGDRYYYGAKPHIAWRVDRDTGAILELNPGSELPELSWPMGVAYDNHRARLLLTSLGGEGFFYAYSPTSNRWSLLRSQNNLDLDCLEYHPSLDALFGVRVNFGDSGPGAIYRFNAEGVQQGEIPLPTFPFGIGPTGYRSELVSVGDYLVLLLEADLQLDPYGESRMYLIDPRNGAVQLTYRHVRPRPNLPPSVQINSPAAGQSFHAPADIQLVAYAQDAEDGYDLKVEFFAGDRSLGFGTFVPTLCPSPYCPNFALTWSNVPPGQYRLKAAVTDSNGTTTVSAPVEITVFDPALSFVTIRATDASASESGDPGTFTVAREGNTNSALRVFYSISGTASNGVDYAALSNSVVLAEGARNATIQIATINDAHYEGTERVELRLVPALNSISYVIGSPSNAVVNIADNDDAPPKPVVTIEAADASASEAPGNPGQFKIRRSGPTNSTLSIFLAISGTASNGVDYARITNLVVLPAGRTVAELPVVPINDNLFEGTETVIASLYYPPIPGPLPFPYTIGSPSNATVTILDHDEPMTNHPPVVRIHTPTNEATFAGPANILICTTPSDGDDYVATVEFFAGDTRLGIQTNTCIPPDCVHIAPETFCLMWSNVPAGNYTLTAKATDNHGASSVSPPVHISVFPLPKPVVTIHATDATASETAGNPGQFRIQRTGPTNQTLQLYLAISGSASNGLDYVRLTNTVILLAGRSSAELVVTPINDNLFEVTETVVATLYYPPIAGPQAFPYVIGSPSNAIVTIADNDEPAPQPVVTIEATDPTASETPGNSGQFRLHRSGPTNHTLMVYLAITGSASNGVDCLKITNVVTIPAGRTAVELVVSPVDDILVEENETVVATLYVPPINSGLPYNIGSPSNATVTILDNDPSVPPFVPAVVTVEATDAHASEPGALTVIDPGVFTIRRSGNTNVTLHVQYHLEGTAMNGADYATLSNIVVIPAGVTATQVFVRPLYDNLPEDVETVSLHLRSPVCIAIYPPPPECYEVGMPGAAIVQIADNHLATNPPPVVTITASDSVAAEGTNCLRWVGWSNPPPANYCGTNTATFVVRRTGRTNEALSVSYEIRGTASNGVDYLALPGVVTIPAGRRAAEIRIIPVDDALRERIETIRLTLSGPPVGPEVLPAYVIGTPARAGAILVDNDESRPGTGPLADRSFHLMRPGMNGAWFRIESSTNLIHWTALCTNMVTDGAIHFVDPDTEHLPSRFYRAVPEANPSAD